ncbi:hypothetical protein A0H81_13387 [Grifola frondosa]|uniref:Uncharacterized protein n=1 Tax=Grifola frondosa TaxID=5627 RepID=A0A1C7LQQ6_GRIFR|nr:hypothetical protein A0H81_13387 [Grifola frondosa]
MRGHDTTRMGDLAAWVSVQHVINDVIESNKDLKDQLERAQNERAEIQARNDELSDQLADADVVSAALRYELRIVQTSLRRVAIDNWNRGNSAVLFSPAAQWLQTCCRKPDHGVEQKAKFRLPLLLSVFLLLLNVGGFLCAF